MPPPFRILKWTGMFFSFTFLAIWIASLWFFALVELPRVYGGASISGGICGVSIDGNVLGIPPVGTNPQCKIYFNAIGRHNWEGLGLTKPEYENYCTGGTGNTITRASIPIWIPLLLTAIPTAWLWHRDRRLISSSPDHRLCLSCGYDLTGNTSGVCPECGDKACPPAVLADSECAERVA